MTDTALTHGVHHVGLTVGDLDEARDFFVNTLGFALVGERPDYPAAFVSDGTVMLTLWRASDPEKAVPFDRKNVIGLHHLALNVESTAALEDMHETIKACDGAEVEFEPQPIGSIPFNHMMCLIPGGIRLEFVAPKS